MARPWSRVALASFCSAAFAGCMSQPEARSGALDYLTRKGSKAVDDAEVKLKLPVRVAIAVPPAGSATGPMRAGLPPTTHRISPETISDRKRRELLDRFTSTFKDRPGIASVQMLPSTYLTPGGGFAELQRAGTSFGFEIVALLSFDQFQFNEAGGAAFDLGTVGGDCLVEGEANETRTVMDASLFDVASGQLLLHATGESSVKATTAHYEVQDGLRTACETGFESAMKDLFKNLDAAAAEFSKNLKSGTVEGLGTPEYEPTEAAVGGP